MTTDTEALRAQFEQYINPEGDVKLHWQPAGHYAGHGVQQSWLDFQAGHAAGAAPMSPVTRAEIAACLRALSRRMIACGTAMDVYGSETMQAHGLELIRAAGIAAGWADGIEGEQP